MKVTSEMVLFIELLMFVPVVAVAALLIEISLIEPIKRWRWRKRPTSRKLEAATKFS